MPIQPFLFTLTPFQLVQKESSPCKDIIASFHKCFLKQQENRVCCCQYLRTNNSARNKERTNTHYFSSVAAAQLGTTNNGH
ncbi:unnamed protein product [Urochloa humidicola]